MGAWERRLLVDMLFRMGSLGPRLFALWEGSCGVAYQAFRSRYTLDWLEPAPMLHDVRCNTVINTLPEVLGGMRSVASLCETGFAVVNAALDSALLTIGADALQMMHSLRVRPSRVPQGLPGAHGAVQRRVRPGHRRRLEGLQAGGRVGRQSREGRDSEGEERHERPQAPGPGQQQRDRLQPRADGRHSRARVARDGDLDGHGPCDRDSDGD